MTARRRLLALVILGACGAGEDAADTGAASGLVDTDSAGTRWARRPATLRFGEEPAAVDVPGEARVGEPLRISLTTYGGGCVREDTTEVRLDGRVAVVTPYQRAPVPGQDVVCTMELRLERRVVDVVFREKGASTVRVVGIAQPGDSTLRVERPVTVR